MSDEQKETASRRCRACVCWRFCLEAAFRRLCRDPGWRYREKDMLAAAAVLDETKDCGAFVRR